MVVFWHDFNLELYIHVSMVSNIGNKADGSNRDRAGLWRYYELTELIMHTPRPPKRRETRQLTSYAGWKDEFKERENCRSKKEGGICTATLCYCERNAIL